MHYVIFIFAYDYASYAHQLKLLCQPLANCQGNRTPLQNPSSAHSGKAGPVADPDGQLARGKEEGTRGLLHVAPAKLGWMNPTVAHDCSVFVWVIFNWAPVLPLFRASAGSGNI